MLYWGVKGDRSCSGPSLATFRLRAGEAEAVLSWGVEGGPALALL